LLYAGAAALGLLLALVAGFGVELRQNVFLGEWELPPGTMVLARLPFIEGPEVSGRKKLLSRGRWFSRRKALAGASAASSFPAAFLDRQ
jgi:hypothetical protein